MPQLRPPEETTDIHARIRARLSGNDPPRRPPRSAADRQAALDAKLFLYFTTFRRTEDADGFREFERHLNPYEF